MRIHGVITASALAFLMGCQLLVTAFPAFDYMWSRINTERYFHSLEHCDPNDMGCNFPSSSNPASNPQNHPVPAMNVPAIAYFIKDTLPAATASIPINPFATPTPCMHSDLQTGTTPAPAPNHYLDLQRRDDGFENTENIEDIVKMAENISPILLPCTKAGCPKGFLELDRAEFGCWCLKPATETMRAE